jgi:hypothetical protein
MSKSGALSPKTLERVAATGVSLQVGIRETADDIMYHELGHNYTAAYGVGTPNNWLGEFLASYLSEAYRTDAPQSPRSRVFADALREWLDGPRPKYTTLEDLERLYMSVGIDNYGWYQAQFEKRVMEVYRTEGLSFVQRVKDAFPATPSERLPVAEVLARLDKISPGWVDWAASLARSR